MASKDESGESDAGPHKARRFTQFGHRRIAPDKGYGKHREPAQPTSRLAFAFISPWSISRRLIAVWCACFAALLTASLWLRDGAVGRGYPPSDPYTPVWIGFCLTLLLLSVVGGVFFHVIGADLPVLPPAIIVPAIYAGVFFSQFLIEHHLLGQGEESFVATMSSDASEFQPPPWCESWTNGKSTCRRNPQGDGSICSPNGADEASLFYCCEELNLPRWCLRSDDLCGPVWRRSTFPFAASLYRPVHLARRNLTPDWKGRRLRVARCGMTVLGEAVSN